MQGDYYIVRRSFKRSAYPLPKRFAVALPNERVIVMFISRRDLFAAPKVRRGGKLDPATDHDYDG